MLVLFSVLLPITALAEDFELLTSTTIGTLAEGDEIVITNGTSGTVKALSTTQNKNNRGSVELTIGSNGLLTPSSTTQIITLEASGTDGQWYLNVGDDEYLYAASSSDNYLRTSTKSTVANNGKAEISLTNDKFSVVFKGTYTRNSIRNNGSLFSCYASGQSDIYIYRKVSTPVVQDPTVTFTPAAGTYDTPQNVKLTVNNVEGDYLLTYKIDSGNEETYNETDGIDITQTCTLTALLLDENNEVYTFTADYVIKPATPTFSPAAGMFTEAQNVTISCATAGATVYYTTDGSDPTDASTAYSAAIPISETTTLKAIAYLNGTPSDVATATYTFASAFELVTDESTLKNGDRIIIASGKTGSVKTLSTKQNSNNRGATDETVTDNKIIPGEDTQVITLVKSGDYWLLQVSENNYLYAVTGQNYLRTSTTTNNTAQVVITIWKSSDQYDNAARFLFQVSPNRLLRYNSSSKIFSCYENGQGDVYLYKEVSNSKAKEPVIAVSNAVMEGDDYIGAQTVTITSPTTGANIYYTTDGTAPTTSSTLYSSAFPVTPGANNAAVTVKAIAYETGKEDPSDVVEFTLNFTNPAAPTITPATKEFTGTTMENVTITTSYANTSIYYTIDGTDPTTSSATYSDAIDMGSFDAINTAKTVKAMVVVNNAVGAVATATYTRIGVKPAAPAITPGTSNISARTNVTITSDDENTVSLRYQLDSGDPVNVNGQTATVTVPRAGGTLTAWAISADGTASDPATATYTYVAPAAKGTFKLVTSDDQIKAGAKFVIANAMTKETNLYLAGPQTGTNYYLTRQTTGFTANSDKTELTIEGTNIEQFTLETSTDEGYFYIKNKAGTYVRLSTSGTALNYESTSTPQSISITCEGSVNTAEPKVGVITVEPKDGASRQLRYNTQSPRFASYLSSNSSELVRFYVQYLGPSLAEVKPDAYAKCDEVTIGNDLQVVYLDGTTAYCRDMEQNSSNFRTPTPSGSYVDYMKNSGMQTGEWGQNNWIELDLSELADITGVTEGCVIKGGSITGLLSDLNNYQIMVYEDAELEIEQAENGYVKNVYCPANFGEAVQTGVNGQTYFLMQPKPMEVAHITWAVWNGSGFYMAERGQQLTDGSTSNMAGLKGGFTVNTSLNGSVTTDDLTPGEAYEFDAIIKRVESSTPAPRRIIDADPSGLNTDFEVFTLTLDPNVVVTGVRDVRGGVQAVDVRYYNAAGVSNAAPWPGVNIIVTTRADGTREVSKRIF